MQVAAIFQLTCRHGSHDRYVQNRFTDVAQQFLELRNLHDACAAKRLQWVVSESPAAAVAANLSSGIIGREPRKIMTPDFTCPTHVPNVFSLPTVPAMIS